MTPGGTGAGERHKAANLHCVGGVLHDIVTVRSTVLSRRRSLGYIQNLLELQFAFTATCSFGAFKKRHFLPFRTTCQLVAVVRRTSRAVPAALPSRGSRVRSRPPVSARSWAFRKKLRSVSGSSRRSARSVQSGGSDPPGCTHPVRASAPFANSDIASLLPPVGEVALTRCAAC
eukprot:SAG22_NODE_685_length_7917_cov_15.152852_2_plen_174_part_00